MLQAEITHLKLSPILFGSCLSEKPQSILFHSKNFIPCLCQLKIVTVCIQKTSFRANYLQETVGFHSKRYFLNI